MKVLLLSLLVTITSAGYKCLNCKLSDMNAGFMYSYQYCKDLLDEYCV